MALPPPPESIVNMYGLTFGTVCGVCAGVFVKKGAKALAFVFGGIFVLLQVSPTISHGIIYLWSALMQIHK
jgi:FUN14 domain-containing protein 1